MNGIKLTDHKGFTKNNTFWDVGITHELPRTSNFQLCTPNCLHFYPSIEIAAFMHSVHVSYANPLAWTCEAEGLIVQDGTKCGCQKLTITGRAARLPTISLEQYAYFGILCALEVHNESLFVAWANKWIDGSDRSRESANAATYTTAASSANAYAAVANAAAATTYANANAYAAATYAYAAATYAAATATTYAAYAAAAAYASALQAKSQINVQALAEKALAWKT